MAVNGAKRILIVEDEPLVAMLIEDMIEALGYRVVGPAMRLDRAVEMARTEELDGAVLDVNMGGARSDPVARALDERAIPYLFATGYHAAGPGTERAAGPILQKPYRQAQVEAALKRLFGEE